METKKKQYKPGQIITLKIKGVNRRYRIKYLKLTKEYQKPACGWCEFVYAPCNAHPCNKLCLYRVGRSFDFKTIEQGRVVPDNCYLLEIKRIEGES